MIKVICGKKGSGKTKKIIELANTAATSGNGCVSFIGDDDKKYIYDLHKSIRYVNYKDFYIRNSSVLEGFVIGLLAGNFDMESIFVDGMTRVIPQKLDELETFFNELEAATKEATIYFTISADLEELPEFMKKLVI